MARYISPGHRIRLEFSGLTAICGLVFSSVMRFGAPRGNYMAEPGFYICAFLGAGLAGWVCAGMFGRGGWRGIVLAGSGAVLMTLMGASLGASFLGLLYGLPDGAIFGLLALADASQSADCVAIWGLLMIGLHCTRQGQRARINP